LAVGNEEEVCNLYHSRGMGNFRNRHDRLLDWLTVNQLNLSWGQTITRAFPERWPSLRICPPEFHPCITNGRHPITNYYCVFNLLAHDPRIEFES
jgi:hypothetical protein